MKKLISSKQAEALKFLFNTPNSVIKEKNKPKKKPNSKSPPKVAWFAGDVELSDKTVESMATKGLIKVAGDGTYDLDEEGRAMAEMLSGQKTYDFTTKMWISVKNYDENPVAKRALDSFRDIETPTESTEMAHALTEALREYVEPKVLPSPDPEPSEPPQEPDKPTPKQGKQKAVKPPEPKASYCHGGGDAYMYDASTDEDDD